MKAAVVYWSGTGNTAAMADLVLEGMKSAGVDADLIECNSVTDLSAYDAIAFGCPAMGSEQLEDSEFEPMFDSVKKTLAGKRVALFGARCGECACKQRARGRGSRCLQGSRRRAGVTADQSNP